MVTGGVPKTFVVEGAAYVKLKRRVAEFGVWPMPIFLFLICAIIAIVGSRADHKIPEEYLRDPLEPMTIATGLIAIVAVAAMVELLRRRILGEIGATRIGLPRSWMLIGPAALLFPLLLAVFDRGLGLPILDASCDQQRVANYFLLAADSLAKGAFVDFMESFRINLHACGFDQMSWWASGTEFGMRSFTTYIIVHMLVQYTSIRIRNRAFVFDG